MKIKTEGYFPFTITAESKKSKAGNDYLSIGIAMSEKNQEGKYESKWFNIIEKRDLLTLASACENAYHKICAEDAREHAQAVANQAAPVASSAPMSDDNIPF